jgi:D-3-phosphoglycerate dehydrogenase / 2-oxoglutarate reductase
VTDTRCLLVQPIHADGWEVLRAAGIEPFMASSPAMAVVAREIGDAVAVITRNAGFDRDAIDAAPRLRVIGNHGIGLDPVDVGYATIRGIPVVNTPHANAESVAELAVTLALAAAKRLVLADRATRGGEFDFKYGARIHELAGKTVGIVGFGRIGRRAAEMFVRAFGMRLLVHAPTSASADVVALGGRLVPLADLLAESDVVSLHVPLRPDTRNLLDAAALDRMKPGAILVNTARGAVVEEAALVEALRTGRLGGAGLDVYASESMAADAPLLSLENVVLTPHVGGSSLEAAQRTAVQVADQVVDVLAGRRPAHLVNGDVWERRR